MVPVRILRVLTFLVVVCSVNGAGLVRSVPQCGDRSRRGIDAALGDDVARHWLTAEAAISRWNGRVRVVDLIARSESEQGGEVAVAHRRSRHRFYDPRRRIEAPDAFIAIHEERTVLAVVHLRDVDGSAYAAAISIQTEL